MVNSIKATLHLLNLIVVLWLRKRIPLFSGYTHAEVFKGKGAQMLVNFSNGSGKIMIYIERPNINSYV